jgi:hypothetical protein
MLGKANFDTIDVGDLISWTNLSKHSRKRRGLVLEKWIKIGTESLTERKVAMLRVVDFLDNQITNIYAINARIESKRTT